MAEGAGKYTIMTDSEMNLTDQVTEAIACLPSWLAGWQTGLSV